MTIVGVSGTQRNACAALCVDGRIVAACEQERLTRARSVGLAAGFPFAAVEQVLALAAPLPPGSPIYAVAEPDVRIPQQPCVAIDHHRAHAATAFLTSPCERAAVLVCDSNASRELSVWLGEGDRLEDLGWPWKGPAFASLYARCAELCSSRPGDARQMEVLAHLGQGDGGGDLERLFRYEDGSLRCEPDWESAVGAMLDAERRRHGRVSTTASSLQRRMGALLLEVAAGIRAVANCDTLCLGGGLFFNTFFNTLIRQSGVFDRTFVPINPGNAGLCVGSALLVAMDRGAHRDRRPLSPFLGPAFDAESTKAALDGCKLSSELVGESEAVDVAAEAVSRDQLVGWFNGRMEWGPRALGHRSILANPLSPYVLDNLNFFLRKRARHHPFGLAVPDEAMPALFEGPATAPFMECEFRPRDDRFRHVMPEGAATLRVQTVARGDEPFRSLLEKVGQATGTPAVVNTSFNAFNEPIVCEPRDAIRVFFGTGLDVLVLGRFVLRK
jgi:carbamoyltransferase